MNDDSVALRFSAHVKSRAFVLSPFLGPFAYRDRRFGSRASTGTRRTLARVNSSRSVTRRIWSSMRAMMSRLTSQPANWHFVANCDCDSPFLLRRDITHGPTAFLGSVIRRQFSDARDYFVSPLDFVWLATHVTPATMVGGLRAPIAMPSSTMTMFHTFKAPPGAEFILGTDEDGEVPVFAIWVPGGKFMLGPDGAKSPQFPFNGRNVAEAEFWARFSAARAMPRSGDGGANP
jgi:hypothetical protein